jgi:membrane protease YdiL (CAAX protease family)
MSCFALPRLQQRFGPLVASLILGLLWASWHAPLAVFPTWTGDRPLLVFAGRYLLLVLPLTLIFTWFFERVGRSVLLAIVLHKTLNLTTNAYGTAIGLPKDSATLVVNCLIVVLWVGAAAIAVHYGRSPRIAERSCAERPGRDAVGDRALHGTGVTLIAPGRQR